MLSTPNFQANCVCVDGRVTLSTSPCICRDSAVPGLPRHLSQVCEATFNLTTTNNAWTLHRLCNLILVPLLSDQAVSSGTSTALPLSLCNTSGMAELYPDLKDRPVKETVCLFDVDGTLTPARQPASAEMLKLLSEVRRKCAIGFVRLQLEHYVYIKLTSTAGWGKRPPKTTGTIGHTLSSRDHAFRFLLRRKWLDRFPVGPTSTF